MRCLALIFALLMSLSPAMAQEPARLDLGASSLVQSGRAWWGDPPLDLRLTLSRAVPFRTYIVGDPVRLIVDLQGVDLRGEKPGDLFGADRVPDIRWGSQRRGWSRIVIELPGPYRIDSSAMKTGGPRAELQLALKPVGQKDFAPPPSATAALRNLPDPAQVDAAPVDEEFFIMLDPGHGGFDPGAQAQDQTEANLVLTFAMELRKALQDRGVTVMMTRDDDSFVQLEQRMTAARAAGADLFISLHADALPQGQAAGATVYIWNPKADGRAAQQLVARHDADDLISGLDLGGYDDALSATLMDFARTDTQPRSENFAKWLTSRMALMGIGLHNRPVQGAAFSVLKSPDIPSVLLELGFISDDNDRANLLNPLWRQRMVNVICEAIMGWKQDETARRAVLRR
ncbi:N-acetylmuramoyl-L-alanine amidase [Paracoccus fistulariae]|uniref:N-acetylmuramoyl-L-alanine amidase n=1 Tax=Paracoccus fistulariae TaxID=658446 RepID=A0ABY7SL23_9RHOB|nr:N-acetylmuramoyl-L-alanine amidase [Paracoccus fistulariae]MDB6181473.1 N-acetylmuramoyl-L-alanine amidase [Paracoccus fistulariae]WCR07511.1 N-acetylmuramoyl-L-alanine amidase [Paracoccus fistulariae]